MLEKLLSGFWKFQISLLSNYPKRQRHSFVRGAHHR